MKRLPTKERKDLLERARDIPNTPVEYDKIKENFAPLDLILFQGSEPVSKLIGFLELETLGNGDFSHVGLLVNSEILPTIPQLQPGRWYVWESTFSATEGFMKKFSDGVANITTGEGKFGVQIRDFIDVCTSYQKDGKVAWAKLINNPWENTKDRKALINKVTSIHELYGNRTYNANFLALLASIFPCLRKIRDNFEELLVDGHSILTSMKLVKDDPSNPGVIGWLFCSQLVALIYQRLGLIPPEIDPDNVVPVDFLGYDSDGMVNLVNKPVYIEAVVKSN